MKHRKQGPLEIFSFTTRYDPKTKKTSGDDERRALQVAKSIGISGLNDFLKQAERLAKDLHGYGGLASEKSETLMVLTRRLQRTLKDGADRWLIYRSIHAALIFAELQNFQSESEKGKKITMAKYRAARAISDKQLDIARILKCSTEAIRLFERKNFSFKRKKK